MMKSSDFSKKYCLDKGLENLSNQRKRELGLLGNTKKGKEAAQKNAERHEAYVKGMMSKEVRYLNSIRDALTSAAYSLEKKISADPGKRKEIASEFKELYSKAKHLLNKVVVAYNTEYAMTNKTVGNNYGKGRNV